MNREQILQLFDRITVWQRGDERAPHKPLLLLMALGSCQRDEGHLLSYAAVDEKLRALLMEFGPARQSYHPEYPFWRLQNDGLWQVTSPQDLVLREGRSDVRRADLLDHGAQGGLTPALYDTLQANPDLLLDVVTLLLERNFPESLHDDICAATGLSRDHWSIRRARPRDPQFRVKVLRAYDFRCAVCSFDLRLGEQPVGLEAAHIKWHQAGGPDTVSNGLCLCALHHKLFDLGAFTLSDDRLLLASEKLHGVYRADEWILRQNGRPLHSPADLADQPGVAYAQWHQVEVFKGRPRLQLSTEA